MSEQEREEAQNQSSILSGHSHCGDARLCNLVWVTSNDVTDVGQYRKRFGHFSFSLVVPYRKAVPKQLHFVGCLDLARGHGAVIAKTVCQISIFQNLEIASKGLLEWAFELESIVQEDSCG